MPARLAVYHYKTVPSPGMHFGTYYFLQATPGRSAAEIMSEEVDQMVLSDRLGFDSVWLTEHHYADYGISAAPSVLLATVAARTERVRLGMAVYVLPFHHPLRLAEETATLDILSRGRIVVGLGRGNRPQEFLGHGVNQDESRTRMEEGLDVLRQAWTQERVTYHGRHWQIDDVPVYPKPLTKPHPPLAFAVTSEESLRWAGRNGFAVMSSGLTTPLTAILKQRQFYLAGLKEGGHDAATVADVMRRWVVSKHVYVAPTDEEARADAQGPEMWYQRRGPQCRHDRRRPRGQSSLGRSGRGATLYRVAGDGAAQDGRASRRRGRGDDLLVQLRRPPTGEGPPLDGALRRRGHARLP
jgi:alkanesulfonate monooxygenase SsuD/methylene tetrahydromethanopterin reductase-like flavin-dependent oxidoreductase (luciferase family)